jgi:hypothetical protein
VNWQQEMESISQAGCNEIQAGRNKNQAECNEIQAGCNEIQMPVWPLPEVFQ